MRPEMKKMMERIMIIRRMSGLTLLAKSTLVFGLRGITCGDDEGDIKSMFS